MCRRCGACEGRQDEDEAATTTHNFFSAAGQELLDDIAQDDVGLKKLDRYMMAHFRNILQILQIFRRLVFGCIDSYDSEKWRIFSHFSRFT